MNGIIAFDWCRKAANLFLTSEVANRFRKLLIRDKALAGVVVCATLTFPCASLAQVVLTNGWPNPGVITAAGQSDSWAITANAGDWMSLQLAKTSGGAGFTPRIEVFAPDGSSLGVRSGALAARIDLQASLAGVYTVSVRDASMTGTGAYRIWVAEIPGEHTVPPGGDGGSLTNGTTQQGVIDVGDLDMWTVAANAGERIIVQVGEVSGGAGFTPMIEIFGPDGARLGIDSGALAARLDLQAELGGSYTVLVSDGTQSGVGTYALHLAHAPESVVVSAGDEGGALPDGADTDGTIEIGDLDVWTFIASPGDRIVLQATELTGGPNFAPKIELFGPGGERKGSAQNASIATIDTAIEAPGAYAVIVSDADQSGAGTYQLNLNRSLIAPAVGDTITNGIAQLGTTAVSGQTNSWTFKASVGEAIVVRVGEISQVGTFSPRIRLLNPNRVQLATSSAASATELAVTATNSGNFTVAIDNTGAGTGTYRLNLVKTGSPVVIGSNDEGGVLTNGTTYLGGIELGDLDTWVFTANPGESIVVRMGEITASLTPQLRLYGPNGALLDSGSGASATEVTARATNAGTFMVVAGDLTAAYAGTGNYRLTMIKANCALTTSGGDEGGSLTNGLTHVAGIDTGDLDPWVFNANTGENIVVRMGETTASLTPQLRLYGPSGALLQSTYGTTAAEVAVRATNSGRFMVVAGDYSSGFAGSGNYRLTLAKTGSSVQISGNDEGGALTNGTTHAGSIEVGDIDTWTLTATPGESMVIRMGEISGALTPQLRIYGPNGALLDSGYGTAATEVAVRATNNGTFMVVAGDFTSGFAGTGNYRITLARTGSSVEISANDEGGALTNGATHIGSIEIGDIDAWTLMANAGDSILIRMGEISGALTPQVRIYGPNGALLDSGYGTAAAEVTTRATNSGVFMVVAGDFTSGFGGNGNYRLTVARTGEPLSVSDGDEGGGMAGVESYDGMIDTGDIDVWSFSARAGDIISINVTELITGSPLTPQLRLYGRDGTLLRSFSGAATAQFSNFVAPTNGTYFVVVSDLSAAYVGTGTYRVTVNGLSDGLKLYTPIIAGANVRLLSVGGLPGVPFTLLTTTDASVPLNLWTELSYQFDQFGVADLITTFGTDEPQRFFMLRVP